MNAKVGLLVGVLILIILGTGGFMFLKNMNKPMMPGSSSDSAGSIKDTLMAAGSMECNYTDEEGRTTKAYIENGKVRADITSSNVSENGSVILADNTIYIWNAQGAFKMKIPEETMSQDLSQNQMFSQREDIMESIEKYKKSCRSANPQDNLFAPPTNLEFKDFTEMMQALPQGAGSNQMSQEQIEQMMQQYSQ